MTFRRNNSQDQTIENSFVLDALPSQRFKNNLIKHCVCLVSLLSFPEDEERNNFFFLLVLVSHSHRKMVVSKRKISSRNLSKLTCSLSQLVIPSFIIFYPNTHIPVNLIYAYTQYYKHKISSLKQAHSVWDTPTKSKK